VVHSLTRSLRVRLVSAIALVFSVISVLALHRHGGHGATTFATALSFVPIFLLANVLLVNTLGIDGNAVLALRGAPVTLPHLCQMRIVISVIWVLVIIVPAWIFAFLLTGASYVPAALLQLGLLFVLAAVGTLSSVVMPVPRPYDRVGAQTAPLPVQIVVMLISLGFIGASVALRDIASNARTQVAAACGFAAMGGLIWLLVSERITPFVIARRERIMKALNEVTQ
jgi:hypothetical protein